VFDSPKTKATRTLRREASPPERILWRRIRGQALGVKFRRQHPIGFYFIDFYCFELKLAVEIDGVQHREKYEYDAIRSAFLESKGIKVIRIPAKRVFEGLDEVLSYLQIIIEERRLELIQKDQKA
jgi:very-short-patch-repair endonuclease